MQYIPQSMYIFYVNHLPISFRVALLVLEQSDDNSSAGEVNLKCMDKINCY